MAQRRAVNAAFHRWKELVTAACLDEELTKHERALGSVHARALQLAQLALTSKEEPSSSSPVQSPVPAPPPLPPSLSVHQSGVSYDVDANPPPALPLLTEVDAGVADSSMNWSNADTRTSFGPWHGLDEDPNRASAHRTILETSFHRAADPATHFLDQERWMLIAHEHGWHLRDATQAFRHFASMRHGHLGLDLPSFADAISMVASCSQQTLEKFLLSADADPDSPLSGAKEPAARQLAQRAGHDNAQQMVNKVMTEREQHAALQTLFRSYATVRSNTECLTSARFAKLCRDCGVSSLVRSGRLRHADIDLAFAKAAARSNFHQAANFDATREALGMLGHRAFVSADSDTLFYSVTGYLRLRAHILANSVEGI